MRHPSNDSFTLIELLVVAAIISLLAALLLPALSAARENARRAACRNNLGQIGQAMAQYLGMYGGYYPGGCAWSCHNFLKDPGDYYGYASGETFADRSKGGIPQSVRLNYLDRPEGDANNPQLNTLNSSRCLADPTCLGAGSRGFRARAGWLPQDRETLKLSPWGVGWLLYTKTIASPLAFYCPSAANAEFRIITAPDLASMWRPYEDPTYSGNPPDTVREWRAAGPMEPETLTHGNWTRRYSERGFSGYAVYGNYVYRNQPAYGEKKTNDTPPRPQSIAVPFTVVFTKPKVTSSIMCPPFKTDRWLQGRALLSDSWLKNQGATVPGFGDTCHKAGYNVLYGDYSVRWFGDPEQRIIYWRPPSEIAISHGYPAPTSNLFIEQYGFTACPWQGVLYRQFILNAPLVWHWLDAGGGMDVDVDIAANEWWH